MDLVLYDTHKAMKRTSTYQEWSRELLVGGKEDRMMGNKTLELLVVPALKEALFIDSGRGLESDF